MTVLAFGTRQPCDEALLRAQTVRLACPPKKKNWVIATSALGSSLAFIEGSAVTLALPSLQADLGLSSAELQWVVNVYLLALGALTLVGGALGDRYGLRRIFIAGCVTFGLGALGCALVRSLPLLLSARLVQGVGGALLVPTSLALISHHFQDEEKGRAIGIWAGASALTTAIGPVLGGWLVDRWSWPAVFILLVPLAALAIAMAWRHVPNSAPQRKGKLDYVGVLLLAGSMATFFLGLLGQSTRWRLNLILLSIAVIAIFIWRERNFRTPILPLRLFRSRIFAGANVMTCLLYAAFSGTLYFLPFNLIQVQGYSATEAGSALLPMTLLLGAGSAFAGSAMRRISPRSLLTIGPLISAAGFFTLAVPGHNTTYLTDFFPAITILGLGMTLSVAPLTTVVMASVDNDEIGLASGVNNTLARLAGALAVAGLTALAVAWFSGALVHSLHEAGVPSELAAQLSSHSAQLAGLRVPDGVGIPVASAIRASVANAYVSTFRALVVVCGLLAIGSAMAAWFSLDGVTEPSGRGSMRDP